MSLLFTTIVCKFIPFKKIRNKIKVKYSDREVNILKDEINKAILLIRNEIAASRLHLDTFGEYKNKFAGKDVVLIATGPTLNDFVPIPNAIYVGVNRAFLYDKVKLDYLFMQDYQAICNYMELVEEYPAKKFYGILNACGKNYGIPESIAIRHHAKRYYINSAAFLKQDLDFVYDITSSPLTVYGTVVSSVMQFLLYANPKRIFLVGVDTSREGYFNEKQDNRLDIDIVIRGWQKIKIFVQDYYPEIEIISINPVGLKGFFKDKYLKK